jgi:hypothetical protein
MKAISLWQPWASLWLSPRKVHETRPRRWPVRRGQWLAVHATKSLEPGDLMLDAICEEEFGRAWQTTLPRGALIGAVLVEGVYRTEDVVRTMGWDAIVGTRRQYPDDLACGDFHSGRFAIKRGAYSVLAKPVPWRGQQVLFDVPDDIFGEVLALRATSATTMVADEVPQA